MANTKLNTPVVVNEYADDYDKGLLVPNNITVYSPKADKEKDNYGIVRWSDIDSDTDSKIEAHNTNPDAHKDLFDSKVDKVVEHPGESMIPATKGEIINNGLVQIKSSTTNLEDNVMYALTVTPYGVSIDNKDGSDNVATKTDVNKKVDIETVRSINYNLMLGGQFKGTVTNTFNTEGIMSIESKAEGSKNDTIKLEFDATRSKLTYNKTSDITYNGEVATRPYVDNKSTADRLYVDTKIDAIKKSVGYVFDTFDNFTKWIAGTYVRDDGLTTSDLNIGDDIFIVEEGTPDYWVKSKSEPMTITDFSPYESGDYKPTITWLEG